MLDFNHTSPSWQINSLIEAGLLAKQKPRSASMGLRASRLGHLCSRALQYEYFGTPRERGFDGAMLKKFDAGWKFEDLAASWLQGAGFDLSTRNPVFGENERYTYQIVVGQVQGSVSGVIFGGPEVVRTPCLWVCKSLEEKDWKKVKKEGLRKFKELHWVEAQLAMAHLRVYREGQEEPTTFAENPALLTAVNRNTCEIHYELIAHDPALAKRTVDRCHSVLEACASGTLLPRIASSPDWVDCRWCGWGNRCYA